MGAGCYKEKNITIQKSAIIQVITDHYLQETILAESPLNQVWLDRQKALGKSGGYKAITPKKQNKVVPMNPTTMESNRPPSQASSAGAIRSVLFESIEDVESVQVANQWVQKHKQELMNNDRAGQPKVVH